MPLPNQPTPIIDLWLHQQLVKQFGPDVVSVALLLVIGRRALRRYGHATGVSVLEFEPMLHSATLLYGSVRELNQCEVLKAAMQIEQALIRQDYPNPETS